MMCLSIPARIVERNEDNMATVDTMGVRRKVTLDLISQDVEIGDYVLIHVGFALNKISQEEAQQSLDAYNEIIAVMKASDVDAERKLKYD